MSNRRVKLSIFLPKIDQDHKDVRYGNEFTATHSFPHEKEQLDLSFPSLLDNNNNSNRTINTSSRSRILEHTQISWSRESTRHGNLELCHHRRNAYGMTVREEKKPMLNLNTENIVNNCALTRDKHITVSPMMGRKFSQLHPDPRYLGMKCTICANNKSVRQKQARVKNYSIIKDESGVTHSRFMQGIQRQDAVDIDESVELGAIKKCCAWMDTWFTEDGKPKEDTDDEASTE